MQHHLYKFTVMTSPCEVHIYHHDATKSRAIASQILEMAKGLEQRYNFYNPNSLLSAINQRRESRLDWQTKELLQRAKLFYTQTEGIFDVTMGTLVATRQQTSRAKVEEAHAQLLPFVGVDHFRIKRDTIHFDNPHTLIDLGGFVKEFAVDMAVKILKKAKVTSALINFGGDIYALGSKPDDRPFSIGIKNPLDPSRYITHLPLQDQALTTSASYERNRIIEGESYSHIISTAPLQERIISTTVLSSSVVESGVFSTSLMIKPTLPTRLQRLLISDCLEINSYGVNLEKL